jgi:putative acetyltransferase
MNIRSEQSGDELAIHELTLKAFEPMSFSDGTEAPIIDQLRKDGDLTISLVATKGREIVGHIAFSPVTIGGEHGGWYGLGPVSVRPDRQKSGIGSCLINEGLLHLKELGAVGCVLIGNPDFYSRFGFRSDGNLIYDEVPAQYVQWLSFGTHSATGVLKFAPAFEY